MNCEAFSIPPDSAALESPSMDDIRPTTPAGVFVAIGHSPNPKTLDGKITTDEIGYIQVKPGTTETNIPGVFACGDVQDVRFRQAISAAGNGCMAAMDCEKFLEDSMVHDWSETL